VACVIYVYHRYPIFHCRPAEFLPDSSLNRSLLSGGFSMALMSCLVAFGTVSLQSAINGLGDNNIVVAHTATRKLSNIFMMPFSVMGTTMATYSGQNYGAGRIDRIKTGLRHSLLALYVWCLLCILISYTVCPYLVTAITSTTVPEIIDTAVLYQKVDTLVYFLVPTIAVLRNSLQGMGDHVTPVLSSSLEMIGKILIAFLLTPILKYWGIILAEPIVWAIMVIPLILSMRKRLKGV
jgi:Na+-driven multidrug efflux pump